VLLLCCCQAVSSNALRFRTLRVTHTLSVHPLLRYTPTLRPSLKDLFRHEMQLELQLLRVRPWGWGSITHITHITYHTSHTSHTSHLSHITPAGAAAPQGETIPELYQSNVSFWECYQPYVLYHLFVIKMLRANLASTLRLVQSTCSCLWHESYFWQQTAVLTLGT
jgi:hypothetical protein